MTQKQFRTKAKLLKKEVNRLIDQRIEKALKSGCLPLDNYEKNSFLLPKAFIAAVGSEIEFQFKPLTKEGIKEMENIKLFL